MLLGEILCQDPQPDPKKAAFPLLESPGAPPLPLVWGGPVPWGCVSPQVLQRPKIL